MTIIKVKELLFKHHLSTNKKKKCKLNISNGKLQITTDKGDFHKPIKKIKINK